MKLQPTSPPPLPTQPGSNNTHAPVALGRDHNAAIFAVLGAMAMVVLDGGMTNVALPTIARTMSVSPSEAVSAVNAYQAAVLMALLPAGALGERFGYRSAFAWGGAVFLAASTACAFAPSLFWLSSAKFVQGLGAAAILALGVALLRRTVSNARLGDAIGWNAQTVALASAVGPAIGAFVLSALSWRWLYSVDLALGAAVLVAIRRLPPSGGRTLVRLAPVSMALNAATFGCVVVAVQLALFEPMIAIILLSIAIAAGIVLVRQEAPKANPLVPLDLLRTRSFRVSVFASISCFAGQASALIALPFFLQDTLGRSALVAGLCMTAFPLGVATTAALGSRLANRAPLGALCATGAMILAAGLASAALLPAKDEPFLLAIIVAAAGLGFGVFQVANNRNMFMTAPSERSGAAGALQGTARLIGQTAGGLMVSLLFLLLPAGDAPQLVLPVAAALAFVAGLVSLRGHGH